jgi:glycosyltransferase involved in cell wall biosynthesis
LNRIALVVCLNGKSPVSQQTLESLADQRTCDGWVLDSLIIVWNGDAADIENAKSLVAASFPKFSDNSIPVYQVLESRIGIPFARNCGIETARKRGAGWLYFIDDECLADSDLLFRLTECAGRENAQVVAGGWEIASDGKISSWLPRGVFGTTYYEVDGRRGCDGDILSTAYTRNVLFDLALVEQSPSGPQRFDESLAESGGSDTRFFFQVSRRGGKIVFADHARVTEKYRNDRLTLRWHVLRRIRNTQLKVLRAPETGEKLLTQRLLLAFLSSVFWRLPFSLLVLPSTLVFGRAGRWVGSTALRLSPYFGLVLLLLGFRFHEYAGRFRLNTIWKNARKG